MREKKLSFYYAMIYTSTHAANEISNFCYRIREDQVVLHDRLHPSFTDLIDEHDDLFKIVTVDLKFDIFEFVQYTKEKSLNQTDYFPSNQNRRKK